jgi:NDP-sugar pyrophosphorylase family protein
VQIAILAGGLGTRLGEITTRVPKAMVKIAERPFLEHQIELFRSHGIDDIVLLVGHFSDQIKTHFGDGARFGVRIRYSDEGDNLLDTAGAVRNAAHLLADEFFLTFGDSYLILPYKDIWTGFRRASREALMVVFRNDNRFDTSDIEVRDGLVVAYQKSPPLLNASFINHGLMALQRSTLAAIPEGSRMSLQSFLMPIIEHGELMAWETHQRFYEIGSASGIRDLETFFAAPN